VTETHIAYTYDTDDKVLTQDDPHNHGPINLANALRYLSGTALPPRPYGCGRCAFFVIEALKFGGAVYDVYADKGYAKNFGPTLVDMGFKALDNVSKLSDYTTPMTGDVVVLDEWTGHSGPEGHMQMYDGTYWLSDHLQTQGFWPWTGSNLPANAATLPTFTVYRYTPPGQ